MTIFFMAFDTRFRHLNENVKGGIFGIERSSLVGNGSILLFLAGVFLTMCS